MGSYPEVEGDMKEMILVLLNKIVSAVSENVKIALKGMFRKKTISIFFYFGTILIADWSILVFLNGHMSYLCHGHFEPFWGP